jgi:RNA polymerase subunit RPABC4/transcription elongation factor Spt4
VKFCFNCGRITPGDPLFCNYCGRSYDIKLCQRMHPNPRRAEVCSRCGSRDFSTPQPLRPVWAPVLQFLLSAIPGFFLVLASVALVLFFLIAVLSNPNALLSFMFIGIALAILWSVWSQIPQLFRRAIYSFLKRMRDGGERGGDR